MSHNKVVRKKAEKFKTIGGRRVSDKEAAEVKRTGFLAAQPTKKPKKSKGRSSGGGSKPAPLPGFGGGTDIGTQFTDPKRQPVSAIDKFLSKPFEFLGAPPPVGLPEGTQAGVAPIAGLGKFPIGKLKVGRGTKFFYDTILDTSKKAGLGKFPIGKLKIGRGTKFFYDTILDTSKKFRINQQKIRKIIIERSEFFTQNQKFGLGTAAANKIDLNYMLRLGDYSNPIGAAAGKVGLGSAQNTKTIAIFANRLKEHLSKNAMRYVMSSWIGSVIIGQWGRAESPEPFSFAENIIFDEAVATNDFTNYNEFRVGMQEIADVNLVQEILLWSPASAFVGIGLKVKGWLMAQSSRNDARDSEMFRIENGLSDDDMWIVRNAERDETARNLILFEQEQLIIGTKNRLAAQKAFDIAKSDRERKLQLEIIRMWDENDRRATERAAEQAKINVDYWLAYQKELIRIRLNNAPSALNFGLL